MQYTFYVDKTNISTAVYAKDLLQQLLVIGDEKGNLQILDIYPVLQKRKVPIMQSIPEHLNSFNAKRKYFQNCETLFRPLLRE